jgi:hypothetical protein
MKCLRAATALITTIVAAKKSLEEHHTPEGISI